MKYIKKLKLLVVVALVFIFCITENKVYGYKIKFVAYMPSKDYALIRSIGQTFLTPKGGYKENNDYNWHYDISHEYVEPGGNNSYQSSAICFHSDLLSSYTSLVDRKDYNENPGAWYEGENNQDYKAIGYDYTNSWINVDSLKADKPNHAINIFYHEELAYVSKKSDTSINKVTFSRDGDKFLAYRNTYGNILGTKETYTLTDWKLSKEAINKLVEENNKSGKNLIKKRDGKENVVYYSLITNTKSNQWNTAFDAITYMYGKGWAPGNLGVYKDWDSTSKNSTIHVGKNYTPDAHVGTSIINHYDNLIQLPKIDSESHEIYVRHVECDDNGNIKKNSDGTPKLLDIANTSEIKISNNGESILNNSPDKISNKNKYQEYYKISAEDQLRVSRSLTIASNSIIYDYKGYSVSSADTLSNAEKQNSTRTGGSTSVNVSALKDSATGQYKKTATIVTLKYCPKPSDEPKPDGGVETLKSGNSTENCQLVYTPTNADIKPYLIANKIKLKDLKYEYEKEGNNIKYSMSIFNIKKLVSGSIADNEDYINNDTGELQGQIFGNEDEKWTLLNGNSPQKFYFTNDVDSISKTFKNNYKDTLPTLSQLKNELINKKTNKSDFSDTFKVPENRYNGLRIPKLIANYEEYDVMTPSNSSKTPSVDYTSNTIKVIVYNPITVRPPTIKSEGVVDHSTTTEQNTSVIQKNADFELTLEKSDAAFYSSIKDAEYLDRYYLIFDIDIVKTDKTSYNKLYTVDSNNLTEINNGDDVIHRGTLIELDKGATTFNAKASNNVNTGDIISQNKSNITLIGVSNNMPGDLLLKEVLYYQKLNTLNSIKNDVYISSESNYNYTINGSLESVQKDYCDASVKYTDYKIHDSDFYGGIEMYGDAYYFAKAVKEITNVGRIYDFKVTDCSDIDYKKVFRETKDNGVNNLKGIVYFSGIKELKIYSNDVNTLEDRTDISISNSVSKRILPLGPYKNTDTSYVNAPKMGYRISFDLKTSGYYKYTAENAITSTREINITPSYYYISKDGQTFNNNINLYYKNSSGKYVKFDGSDYTIYFKPKDGYRSIYNATAGIDDDSIMSDQLEPLEIGSSEGFTLNYKMMSTSGNNFLQAWYGEFKLPNSTIAVEGNNVAKPLTDGYIGVIFDIQCIDNKGTTNEKILSYNKDNKNANPNTNTTQWDYEGFLGFSNPGSKSGDISIQLEKGTWIVNDDNVPPKAKYTDIKGTVALFDIDNRAANDFD